MELESFGHYFCRWRLLLWPALDGVPSECECRFICNWIHSFAAHTFVLVLHLVILLLFSLLPCSMQNKQEIFELNGMPWNQRATQHQRLNWRSAHVYLTSTLAATTHTHTRVRAVANVWFLIKRRFSLVYLRQCYCNRTGANESCIFTEIVANYYECDSGCY